MDNEKDVKKLLRVPLEVADRIQEIADAEFTTWTEIARRALVDYLKNGKPKNTKTK